MRNVAGAGVSRRGTGVASTTIIMNRTNMSFHLDTLDSRPGSAPDIRTGARGVTFEMHSPGTRRDERLLIRCDDDGEVWIAIQSNVSDAS